MLKLLLFPLVAATSLAVNLHKVKLSSAALHRLRLLMLISQQIAVSVLRCLTHSRRETDDTGFSRVVPVLSSRQFDGMTVGH